MESVVSTIVLVDIPILSFMFKTKTWVWRKNIKLSKTRENMEGWKLSQKQTYSASYCGEKKKKKILSLIPGCLSWFRVELEAGHKSQKEGILSLVFHYQKCTLCLKSCAPHKGQPLYGGNSRKWSGLAAGWGGVGRGNSPIWGFWVK